MRPSVAIEEVAMDLEGARFVHDPDPTMYGITQGVYDSYRRLRQRPQRSVAEITYDEVVEVYSANYWEPLKASQLPDGVDFALFQMAVNIGNGRAVRILQRILAVEEDGVMGPQTLGAAAKRTPSELADALLDAQDRYYDSIYAANPTRNAPYIKGWHNRVSRVRLFLKTGLTEKGVWGLGLGGLLLLTLFILGAWGLARGYA